MDETPKQLAQRLLREMVSEAAGVIRDNLCNGPKRNQQALSADAWKTLDTVLEMPDEPAAQAVQAALDDVPLEVASETLRLVKQTERRQR